jgi:PAS domain S-box-containing protein
MCGVGNYDGYFIAVSAAYTRILGWAPDDLYCVPYWELLHPDEQDAAVESGDPLTRERAVRAGYEMRLLCRDGNYRWTQWDTVSDPATELVYGYGVDITAGKPPLKESRVSVGTWTRDIDTGSVSWSDELYAIFGLPVGPLTDEQIRARIHPEDHPLVEGAWRASLAAEDAHAANYRVVRPDGSIRLVHSTGRVMARKHGQPATIRGITTDITDRLGPDG